ncbi:MAG: hypothetical protein QG608_2657 [Actinomycetota bacterium]|nr:hypothetical protein [Actinomycetota bacterium]
MTSPDDPRTVRRDWSQPWPGIWPWGDTPDSDILDEVTGPHSEPRPRPTATPAGVYGRWLAGKDNRAHERVIAETMAEIAPFQRAGVTANRDWLATQIHDLVTQQQIRQLIDVGCGYPLPGANLHEIAHRTAPDARTVYVDNDEVVLAHARALMTDDASATVVIDGDARYPDHLFDTLEATGHLDLTRPVALIFAAVLHLLTPDDDPARVVTACANRLAPGSYLLISHVALPDEDDPRRQPTLDAAALYSRDVMPFTLRTYQDIAALFGPFTLLDPPGLATPPTGTGSTLLAGTGRLS